MSGLRRRRANDDPELLAVRERDRQAHIALFDRFNAQVVSPGGAARLLGVDRKTVHTLVKRGNLRIFRAEETDRLEHVPRWAYIPLEDVEAYAAKVGRPLPDWTARPH